MKNFHMMFSSLVQLEDKRYWFFDVRGQCICNMDEEYQNVQIVRMLQWDIEGKFFSVDKIFEKEKVLYLTASNSADMLAYDMHKNRFKVYQNPTLFGENIKYIAEQEGDLLFLIPNKLNEKIHLFHMAEKTFKEKSWKKNIAEEDIAFLITTFREKHIIWCQALYKNYMIKLDLKNFLLEKVFLPSDIEVARTCMLGREIWSKEYKSNCIVHWGEEGIYERINLNKSYKFPMLAFSAMIPIEENLVFLPAEEKKAYVCNSRTREIMMFSFQIEENPVYPLINGYYQVRKKLILLPWGIEDIYELDMENGRMERKQLGIDKEYYSRYIYPNEIVEQRENGLQEFLNYAGWIKEENRHLSYGESYGSKIYRMLKEF